MEEEKTVRWRQVTGPNNARRELTKRVEEDMGFIPNFKSCPAGGSSTAHPAGCSKQHGVDQSCR